MPDGNASSAILRSPWTIICCAMATAVGAGGQHHPELAAAWSLTLAFLGLRLLERGSYLGFGGAAALGALWVGATDPLLKGLEAACHGQPLLPGLLLVLWLLAFWLLSPREQFDTFELAALALLSAWVYTFKAHSEPGKRPFEAALLAPLGLAWLAWWAKSRVRMLIALPDDDFAPEWPLGWLGAVVLLPGHWLGWVLIIALSLTISGIPRRAALMAAAELLAVVWLPAELQEPARGLIGMVLVTALQAWRGKVTPLFLAAAALGATVRGGLACGAVALGVGLLVALGAGFTASRSPAGCQNQPGTARR